MSEHFIKPDHDEPQGVHCRRCGWFITAEQDHSYAIGPQAGHYCFGCEPPGAPITTIRNGDCNNS